MCKPPDSIRHYINSLYENENENEIYVNEINNINIIENIIEFIRIYLELREQNYFRFLQTKLNILLFSECDKTEESEILCYNKSCKKCFNKSLQSIENIKEYSIFNKCIPRLIYINKN